MPITSLAALRALYDPARERSVKKELPHLDVHGMRFIGLSPLVVVASGAAGALDASPRGGAPGFVKVVDAHTLLIPDAPGNNRLDTLENIAQAGEAGCPVGLLFLVPGVMRSDLWNPARHLDRSTLPSMGEMMRDQILGQTGQEVVAETQAEMLERYRQTL